MLKGSVHVLDSMRYRSLGVEPYTIHSGGSRFRVRPSCIRRLFFPVNVTEAREVCDRKCEKSERDLHERVLEVFECCFSTYGRMAEALG